MCRRSSVFAKMASASNLFLGVLLVLTVPANGQYLGKHIGSLSPLQHDVSGEVYAVDSRTLHIKGFSYDGTAPDAFFYAGTSGRPSDVGIIIPDENGSTKPLSLYSGKDVTLTLPEGLTLKDIRWISIWCRAFAIDFGHIMMPNNLQYPRPQKINALSTLEHEVSSDRIVVVDAQTFLIPNFSYDGAAPDAHFWVGKGATPGPQGTVVPDENGATKPLKRYSAKTIVITLPDHLTVFDIDYLSVWCKAFFSDFGNVKIPRNLNVPPSLKMLGVAPQTKLNCEVLYDGLALEVRWAVAGESIVMQLVGRVDDGEYMSFGLSGSETSSVMVGGDVVTAWLERNTGKGFAQDYHLGAKAQCQGGGGSCPDSNLGGRNDVRLLNAALINDFTMLTFQRPLRASDSYDKTILTDREQAVIWAVGPVNSQGHTSYHTLKTRGNMLVDFGRSPKWNCPLPDEQSQSQQSSDARETSPQRTPSRSPPRSSAPAANAWFIPPIACHEPEDGVFYAQIGPTGGESGYNAITGHVGWGIAYYINGLLIPEIHVVRGKTYTFVVEGGHDPANPSRSHPLYITDDPEGGYKHKTPAERDLVQVFAGISFDRNNNPNATAYGRLCEWKQTPGVPASSFNSFGAYQRSLDLQCEDGQPGILQWTPDRNTPDTVYYHCYTHRFLGWKIHVHDSCSSDQQTLTDDYNYYDDLTPELQQQGSTQINRRVTEDEDLNVDNNNNRRQFTVGDDRITARKGFQESLPTDHRQQFPVGFDSFPFKLTNKPEGRKESSRNNGADWSSRNGVSTYAEEINNKVFDIEHHFNSIRSSPAISSIENKINSIRQTTTDTAHVISDEYSFQNHRNIPDVRPTVDYFNDHGEHGIVDLNRNHRHTSNGNKHYKQNDLDFSELYKNQQNDKHIVLAEPVYREVNTPTPSKVNFDALFMVQPENPVTPLRMNKQPQVFRNQFESVDSVGFKPDSIVFESDFTPIFSLDSPGPPHLIGIEGHNKPQLLPPQGKENEFSTNHHQSNPFSHVVEVKPKNTPEFSYARQDFQVHQASPVVFRQHSNPSFNKRPQLFSHIPPKPQTSTNLIQSKRQINPELGLPQINHLPDLPHNVIQLNNIHSGKIRHTNGTTPNFKQVIIPPFQGANIQLGGNLFTNSHGPKIPSIQTLGNPSITIGKPPIHFSGNPLMHHIPRNHPIHTSRNPSIFIPGNPSIITPRNPFIHTAGMPIIHTHENPSLNRPLIHTPGNPSLNMPFIHTPGNPSLNSILSTNQIVRRNQVSKDGRGGVGISSHFKSPQDPPVSFDVHHMPPTGQIGGPQILSGVPQNVQFNVPLNRLRGRRPGRPGHGPPFRRRRPNRPGRNPNGPARRIENKSPVRHRIDPKSIDRKDTGVVESENKPVESISSTTGTSFLQNIWSTLTGSSGSSDTTNGRNIEPKPRNLD